MGEVSVIGFGGRFTINTVDKTPKKAKANHKL